MGKGSDCLSSGEARFEEGGGVSIRGECGLGSSTLRAFEEAPVKP